MDIKSYLTADNPKYSIPDGALDTKVVFFDTFPKRRDIERGYATTADETQGGVKILGEATPLLTAPPWYIFQTHPSFRQTRTPGK